MVPLPEGGEDVCPAPKAWDWRGPLAGLTSSAMIVSCPECGARYKLPPQAIPSEGRAMRCASCKHRWFELGAEEAVVPVAPIPAPEMFATMPMRTPEALADDLSPHAMQAEIAGADEPDPPTGGVLKTLLALLLSAALFAGAAAMWLPDLPPLDLSRVPWLDALFHPPAPARTPLTVRFTVERQPLGDGRMVFALTGMLTNPTAQAQTVPEVEARLVDAGGRVTYRWPVAVPSGALAPRASQPFDASAIGDAEAGARVVVALR